MAYDTKQLKLLTDRLVGDGMNIWSYDDTANAATVSAADYISDAGKLKDKGRGMAVGDIVYLRQWASLTNKTSITAVAVRVCSAISATGGATLVALAA